MSEANRFDGCICLFHNIACIVENCAVLWGHTQSSCYHYLFLYRIGRLDYRQMQSRGNRGREQDQDSEMWHQQGFSPGRMVSTPPPTFHGI